MLAGVTVAALALPAGMAYAELAGLSPAAGLYALLLPTVAYTLLGPSRQLIGGPEGSIAVLVATAIIPLAADDPGRFASLASLLALLVAAIYLVARIIRLGWVADFLSRAALVGYIHGVAVFLIIGQLEKLFGWTSRPPIRSRNSSRSGGRSPGSTPRRSLWGSPASHRCWFCDGSLRSSPVP